ncbi:RNA polymerase sigma factor [Mucilaginibacter gotjawali]|uniref:ECF RNA polymerase sigma factor SigW n=2 Tax=Mucilaginibacter gotjawali TaxID=1550579 RepID=A0A0X8X2P4_9SPHI|nr:RNA polymerase sigma-70 factor [Mucilaginibacter gotjawali]MBB3053800.1 RNA polymerase sigma-70 factor (ECF subfamily) [Mucilaginibacter gotjawali]BAU54062.1 ECF RNA polymerase sigma factor SigW [Mucilaginibacter gotjawali]
MVAYNSLSDHELTGLLKTGDRAAFTEIYQRYKWVLFLHALKRIRDREQAKDIIQELFTTLWDRRNDLELRTHLSGYLYTSVRNRIIKSFAHQQVESDYINSLVASVNEDNCITDHKVRQSNLAALIEKEINELPEKMREVFLLSRKQNLSHKEIAFQLGIEESTVKRQISNALKILRVKLGLLAWLALLFKFL